MLDSPYALKAMGEGSNLKKNNKIGSYMKALSINANPVFIEILLP